MTDIASIQLALAMTNGDLRDAKRVAAGSAHGLDFIEHLVETQKRHGLPVAKATEALNEARQVLAAAGATVERLKELVALLKALEIEEGGGD